MEVRADPGHQRPAGWHPPGRVAVAGINANACETAGNGVLRSGLRLTATRVPWCRHHPIVAQRPDGAPHRTGDLTQSRCCGRVGWASWGKGKWLRG